MQPEKRTVAAQPSWIIESRSIEIALTELGGMMAPVLFYRDSRKPIQPYYVSPWQEENAEVSEPVLVPLRGDFFCMPFGADNAYKGETHVVHGEPATSVWGDAEYSRANGRTEFSARMTTTERAGEVTKRIMLKDDQNVVYCQHRLSGYSGKTTLGHHATLTPGTDPGGMIISTSPIAFGLAQQVPPGYNANGEYVSLDGAKPFRSISRVPTLWKDPQYADIGRFPARRGYCDIAGVVSRLALPGKAGKAPGTAKAGVAAVKPNRAPAWTVALFPGGRYLWFSLKDAVLLPVTVFWMENHGRHAAPWSGRNLCIGLEEICGFLAGGLAPSAKKNPISDAGVPTVVTLSPKRPTLVNNIQGVTRVPEGFDRVKEVDFSSGSARFVADSGARVDVSVDWEFIFSGDLA